MEYTMLRFVYTMLDCAVHNVAIFSTPYYIGSAVCSPVGGPAAISQTVNQYAASSLRRQVVNGKGWDEQRAPDRYEA